jgi:hypothetical protein
MQNAIQDPLDRLSNIIEGEKSPFVLLSERMRTTSEDVKNLNLSILDLAIALEKRAGVSKDTTKEKKPVVEEQVRTLSSDVKDIFTGFTGYFKEQANYITGKTSLPSDIKKIKPTDTTDIKASIPENIMSTEPDQNRVLADMVDVLIDMRDDTSQKQLLQEAQSIKKIINDENKKLELPKGIEPNSETEKQEDREKLAEAIARRLGEIFNSGNTNPFNPMNLDPDLPDRPNRTGPGKTRPGAPPGAPPTGQPKTPGPGGKTPPTSGGGKFKLPKLPPGLGMAGRVAGAATGIGGLMLGAIEASEYLDEAGLGDKIQQGAGQDAEKAFKNINADFSKLDITPEQAQDILDQPDSPGKQRDLKAFGGEDELKKRASERKKIEQASLRKYDYVEPKTSPKIDPFAPKQTETNIGKVLNEVSDRNTELKMFNMDKGATQMLAPIVSNNTINNTEQTLIGSSPLPHSNANSLNRWQQKRSNYTD